MLELFADIIKIVFVCLDIVEGKVNPVYSVSLV